MAATASGPKRPTKIQIHHQINGKHHHADGNRHAKSDQSFEDWAFGEIETRSILHVLYLQGANLAVEHYKTLR